MSFDEALREKALLAVKRAEHEAIAAAQTAVIGVYDAHFDALTTYCSGLGYWGRQAACALVGSNPAIAEARERLTVLVVRALTNKVLSNA